MRLAADAIARARELGGPGPARRGAVDRPERRQRLRGARPDDRACRGADAAGPGHTDGADRAVRRCYHRCAALLRQAAIPRAAGRRPCATCRGWRTSRPNRSGAGSPGAVSFGMALCRGELDRAAAEPRPGATAALELIRRPEPRVGADGIMTFALRRETGLPEAARAMLREPGDPERVATGRSRPGHRAAGAGDLPALAAIGILGRDLADLQASAIWPAVLSYLVDAAAWLGDDGGRGAAAAHGHAVRRAQPARRRVPAPLGSADLPHAPAAVAAGAIPGARALRRGAGHEPPDGRTLHEARTLASVRAARAPAPDAGRQRRRGWPRRRGRSPAGTGLRRVLRELDELAATGRPAGGSPAGSEEILALLGRGLSNRDIAADARDQRVHRREPRAVDPDEDRLQPTGPRRPSWRRAWISRSMPTREPSGRTR